MTKSNAKKEETTVTKLVTGDTVNVTARSLYVGEKKINAALDTAIKNAKSVMNELQIVACSVIQHIEKCGDVRGVTTILERMLKEFPKGMHKKAMAKFFDDHAQVSFDKEGKVSYDKNKPCRLAVAMSTPWWKSVKNDEYVPFVFSIELEKIAARAEKRFENADPTKGDAVTMQEIAALRKLIDVAKKSEAAIAEANKTTAEATEVKAA